MTVSLAKRVPIGGGGIGRLPMRNYTLTLSCLSIITALFLSSAACTKAPPSLTPAGQADFNRTRVIKAIDLIRDVGIDAEAAHVISTDDTRQVVLWHKSAVNVVAASETGWKGTVTSTLDEALSHTKPPTQAKLAPYVSLLKALIAEVN